MNPPKLHYLNWLKAAVFIAVLAMLTPSPAFSQGTHIQLRVDSVITFPGQQNVEIPVYLVTDIEDIAAFDLWFNLEQPDIMEFEPVENEMIITEGTLLESLNWDHFSQSIAGNGYDLRIIADGFDYPNPPALLGALSGDIPLFKMSVDVYNVADTITDSTVYVHVIDDMLDHFNFVDPLGNSIGITTTEVEDTSYFQCLDWVDDECLWWEQVTSGMPYDSIEIDTILHGEKIPGFFEVTDGSLTVLLCGDINVDKTVNILDIIAFIEYKLGGGDDPTFLEVTDVNHDGAINILDIVALIEYKFKGGTSPACY